MAVVRCTCDAITHDDVLLSVPDVLAQAYAEQVEVFCPECNIEMDEVVV